MPANPKCWVRCVECGGRDLIRRSWLERRWRVRCSRCGGAVEASNEARRALVKGMDRKRQLQEQQR